jgi:phenylpropionate dioxygenase-like ring-hydroxylating dioxygenase large terminal subunit
MMELDAKRRPAPHDGLADEHTPFIRNAWYVACFSNEVKAGEPFGRRLLGEQVVLYRKRDGRPVALKDRCPHRSFPLSASGIEGDDIVCRYHGIRYGPDGACKHIPTQDHAPRAMRVPNFLVVETAPVIWIWLGDHEVGERTPLPEAPWMLDDHGWASSRGYMRLNASYVFLHENLLDLSHLSFLHANSFGTPDYASAPYETDVTEARIEVRRAVSPTRLPPIYADPLAMAGKDAARIVTSTYLSPGLSISAVLLRDLTEPEASRTDHHIRTAQLLTPCDADYVHYHFVVARDFVRDDEEVSQFILANLLQAFEEDAFALESLARNRREDPDRSFREMSVASDKAGVMLRRRLYQQAMAEQARTQA